MFEKISRDAIRTITSRAQEQHQAVCISIVGTVANSRW